MNNLSDIFMYTFQKLLQFLFSKERIEVGQKVTLTCNFAPAKYFKSHAIVVGHIRVSVIKFFDVYEIQFEDGFTMKVTRNNLQKSL